MRMRIVEHDQTYNQLASHFDCGNYYINYFLRTESLNNDISKTYLLVDEEAQYILGFFSLSADTLVEILEREQYQQMGPAIRIYMFAVDKKYQHQKFNFCKKQCTIASFLLSYCIKKIKSIVQKNIGACFIILSSTHEGYQLYRNKGDFEVLDEDMKFIDIVGSTNMIDMYRNIEIQDD